jgi:hypothetical protein
MTGADQYNKNASSCASLAGIEASTGNRRNDAVSYEGNVTPFTADDATIITIFPSLFVISVALEIHH